VSFCDLTPVLGDGHHLLVARRQAEDAAAVDTSLRLQEVLEGAVDARRQAGDVLGLQHQLVERG